MKITPVVVLIGCALIVDDVELAVFAEVWSAATVLLGWKLKTGSAVTVTVCVGALPVTKTVVVGLCVVVDKLLVVNVVVVTDEVGKTVCVDVCEVDCVKVEVPLKEVVLLCVDVCVFDEVWTLVGVNNVRVGVSRPFKDPVLPSRLS
ncbi:hypothetical protein BX600DRAFT_519855 [Xylariales sp. PMI_506]|nr:hypothetical protein BX600DRAFT_519855 [Xylariales sp. PMI_506]